MAKKAKKAKAESKLLTDAREKLAAMEKVVNTNSPYLNGDFINRQKVQQQRQAIKRILESEASATKK